MFFQCCHCTCLNHKCGITNVLYNSSIISQLLYPMLLLIKATMPKPFCTTFPTCYITFRELGTCTPMPITLLRALPFMQRSDAGLISRNATCCIYPNGKVSDIFQPTNPVNQDHMVILDKLLQLLGYHLL